MKIAKLIHNPAAGDEQYSKNELVTTIEANGFECIYSTAKKNSGKNVEPEVDFLIVAGGDGTIRKITKELLDRKVLEKTIPIALLPLGTSNNIARTLKIFGTIEEIVQSWHAASIKEFDVGIVSNDEQLDFFLESYGYGIFPSLMREMENQGKNSIESSEAKTQASLKLLHRITLSYEPMYCDLQVNGEDYSGEYLLAEVMNTRSIGPTLSLAPDADPGDGEMDLVLLTKDHREQFASYVEGKIKGVEGEYSFDRYKAKEVKISWGGTDVHIDDKITKGYKAVRINIEVKEKLLQFLVPQEASSSH